MTNYIERSEIVPAPEAAGWVEVYVDPPRRTEPWGDAHEAPPLLSLEPSQAAGEQNNTDKCFYTGNPARPAFAPRHP